MKIKISSENISSFVGDILPLWLISEENLRFADIKWTVIGEAAHIRSFEKEEEAFKQEGKLFGFRHGVLVTLDKPGEAKIIAELNEESFECRVTARNILHTESGRMNYYTADLHNHTTMIHRHDELHLRNGDFQEDYVKYIKENNDIDLSVISDHADVIDGWEFFKGFTETEAQKPMDSVILPGAESEITLIEIDRYGQSHKNSGEIVTLCADNFAAVKNYEEFLERMATSPHLIATLAHPQVIGFDKNGIWNFSLEKHRNDGFREVVKLIEMGDGYVERRDDDIINEYIYSVALDNGYRVSTTCSSDKHEAPWGKNAYGGKTIVMAPEKTKEAFIDALRSGRCYCSESGNVKLYCEVNGKAIPCDLESCNNYKFHIEVGYFEAGEDSAITKCALISDYGKKLAEFINEDFSSFDFEIESDSARWFYLRFEDKKHRKTLSPPIYCTRKYDDAPSGELKPIDKSDFEAKELVLDIDASVIINDNPCEAFEIDIDHAEILIDMKQERTVSAIGHYPYRLIRRKDINAADVVAAFAAEYEVMISADGESFTTVAEGAIRVYGGEVIIRFSPKKARYIKFKVLSNTGKLTGYPRYENLGLKIGELTVFE